MGKGTNWISIGLAIVALCGAASLARAQSSPAGPGSITFTPGVRLQVRYTYDNADANNDFYIARTRLKATGKVFEIAKYNAEIKLDNVGRFARDVNAQVENAWLDFPIGPALSIRAGLYDAVLSRNALTSDSKLLLMDRSMIKDALTALGLADNTVGLLVHGRPSRGHIEYSAGVFDNLQFEQATSPTARQADGAMGMGRMVFHLLDPATPGGYADYQSSYIGKGRRLSIGADAAYLSKAREGTTDFDVYAWGGDLFFNSGAFTFEAEYDRFGENIEGGVIPDMKGDGWYVQGGYLLPRAVELAARYQELDRDRNAAGDRVRWTSLGVNKYLQGHNLKVQADYTFKREQLIAVNNDLFQVQLQLDF